MADRYPLVVDSSNQNIKELPDGDSLLLGDSEKLRFGDGQDLNFIMTVLTLYMYRWYFKLTKGDDIRFENCCR